MAKSNVKYLGRDDVLTGTHFRCHEIEIGDGVLLIRELTAEEWLDLGKAEREADKEAKTKPDDPSYGLTVHFARVAELVCKTAVDDKGARIFQDGDSDNIHKRLGAETLLSIYKQLAQVAPPAEGGGSVGGS